jgi:uncharacterized protein
MGWGTVLERSRVRIGLILAVFCVLIYAVMIGHVLERMLIYFPSRQIEADPSAYGLEFEDVWLKTEDGIRIHGWHVPNRTSGRTILVFHGNAGNISHRVSWIRLLHELPAAVLIIDYRGYGKSEGEPFEEGLYRDARAAWNWLDARQASGLDQSLVLLGESLGGAVAVNLAARAPCAGLILQSTFSSAQDMSHLFFPLGLLRPLAGVRFDSLEGIKKVAAPKLVIHGNADEIVPFELGRKLFDAAPQPKDFYEVPGAHHNDLVVIAGRGYFEKLRDFLKSLPPRVSRPWQ